MKPDRRATSQSGMGIIQDTGLNGLPRIVLTHSSGASVEIYRHGAHVTAWKNEGGENLLFLSRESRFERSHPIRGGIPVVFPQFSDEGALPKHGFARTNEWALVKNGQLSDGTVFATLRLEENPDTIRIWPHRFALEYSVRLSDALAVRLSVTNTGDNPFRFQIALHTYFQVADIRLIAMLGLRGIELVDGLRQNVREKETRERIAFEGETDRVYVQAPNRLILSDAGHHRELYIEKSGMNDVVIWNPWIDKSVKMEDFGDDEYQRMVCVETGNIAVPIVLSPGARWEGATKFSVGSE
ncbi:MAG: D-hexose-6-phosphate mutarotase [Verrucomicrobia bacterium]|nr:D-hexose-6-phosphate mutarotase [Verrucomicrobiota bacterium]MBU4247194.1 D-hexose-6-phosphate mutarotase [Verrucomicrobiota bacterium]MBU4291365.1 D-hexose-6-phosphate mutarotase [Verrucomicrobiota bacterium]MBU4497689.1 D-hexose-6-phosphate mutarotase [Verrucomicrobiota bacterium]MCG2680671.1 D-hexose-6-phosphate mutarotase [Kiritimatiellia bacterium]